MKRLKITWKEEKHTYLKIGKLTHNKHFIITLIDFGFFSVLIEKNEQPLMW